MADMVERVALAIKSKVPFGYGMTDAETLEYARAAIEAMREPTDAMVGRVEDAYDGLSALTVQYIWSGMIDAALSRPDPADIP